MKLPKAKNKESHDKLNKIALEAYEIIDEIQDNPLNMMYTIKQMEHACGIYDRLNNIQSIRNSSDYIAGWMEADELIKE